MSPETIQLVQDSYQKIAPISAQAARLFYNNLFEADPSLKPLFKGDMEAQGQKLMQVITTAVLQLNNLETLGPILQNLGRRHVQYGVKDEDYETVGTALLKTLEQGLGSGFTQNVRNAWVEVYGVMTKVMKDAAHEYIA